jgi:putative FmdB family regulatory protein
VPLYDYQCDQCGHRFEVRQGIKEDPLTVCPECGGAIRRVIHPVGIVFKGSGFYITDSRKQSSATSSPSSNGAEPAKPEKAEKADSSSGESKPAATATASTSSSASSSSGSSSESKTT